MSQTLEDVFNEDELAAVEDTRQTHQERQQKQSEFLDTLGEQTDVDVVETQVQLAEGIMVPVRVELTGELTDRLAEIESLTENIENTQSVQDVPETVDRACQLLADCINDSAYDKNTFYKAYRANNDKAIAKMLRRVFEAVEREQKRQKGDADGFRDQG